MNRAQQSGYGLGQGPPPSSGGRFSSTPSRQGSTPLSPQQQQLRQPFAFGQGQMGLGAMSPQQGAQLSHAAPEASLDPSDFPALGGGAPQGPTSASTAAHLAAQQAQQHLTQQQHRQQQHSLQQQQSQQSILSSYASQASPATPAPPSTAGSTANGAAPRRTAGDNAADDFPALGGLPHLANGGTSAGSPAPAASAPGQPLLPPGMGMGMFGGAGAGAGAAAPGAGAAGELSALAQGVDTLSLAAARAAVSQGGQEQASALAALQAQQQHRASLLGAMNAQRGAGAAGGFAPPGGDKTSWTQSPQSTPRFPTGLAPNGSTPAGSSTSAASSPLPPSAADAPHPPHPSLPDPRSPSSALAFAPPPAAAAGALPPPTAGVTTGGVPQTPAQQVLFSPADRYGLLGLLHIIKTSDPDTSMLALGTDLTNLGLDLGSTENLYSTFITPWTDSKAAAVLNIEPEFHLPSCYNVQPPPANTKIGNFSDETLFFIFYSQPRDAMQEMAAHELYKHNWRYHKELRLWLTKEAGTEPVQKTATFERGSYIFFDPVLWERVRKEYVLFFDQLETRRADVARGAAGGAGGGGGGASAAGSL